MGTDRTFESVVFSGGVEQRDGRYVIEIPQREITDNILQSESPVRVGLLEHSESDFGPIDSQTEGRSNSGSQGRTAPVAVDETITVTIEGEGREGDGLAKVSGGFIIFVPETDIGDQVLVRITDIKGTFASAEVIKWL